MCYQIQSGDTLKGLNMQGSCHPPSKSNDTQRVDAEMQESFNVNGLLYCSPPTEHFLHFVLQLKIYISQGGPNVHNICEKKHH